MQTHTGCCSSTMGVLSSQLPYPASIGYLSRFIPGRYLHNALPHTHTHTHTHITTHTHTTPNITFYIPHWHCSISLALSNTRSLDQKSTHLWGHTHTHTHIHRHTHTNTHTHTHTHTHRQRHRHTQTWIQTNSQAHGGNVKLLKVIVHTVAQNSV